MKLKTAYILCALTFILLCFQIPQSGGDIWYWQTWCVWLNKVGLHNCYTIDSLNYNPLYIYILRAYAGIAGSEETIKSQIHNLKIFTLLFDFGAAVYLLNWFNKNGKNLLLPFILLLNAAYLYNTICWGQIDAIPTFFIMVAIATAINVNLLLSSVMYLLALNVKTQSVIFLPVMILLCLPLLRQVNLKYCFKIISVIAAVQIAILLPFIVQGKMGDVINNLIAAPQQHPYVSLNAYNFWYLVFNAGDHNALVKMPVTLSVWGMQAKTLGLILFSGALLIVLIPSMLQAVNMFRQRKTLSFNDAGIIFLTAGLVAIISFYFLTQMHERYAHPAILFTGIYAMLSRRWAVCILVSIATLLNLESLLDFYGWVPRDSFIFDPRLVATIYGTAILVGVYDLYTRSNVKQNYLELKGKLVTQTLG